MSDERLFEAVVRAAGEIPLGDGLTAPSLASVDGVPVRAGTPVEIMASIASTRLTREGLRKAGRTGMAVQNAIATAASDQAKIAGSQFGMRPSDGWLIGATVELKADWERLNEVAFVSALGGHIVAETCPMVGGYCGGPEGLAVANVAYHLQSILVFRGSYHLNFSIELHTACGTGRGVIWGTSASAQAITRNSHFPLQTSGLVAAGPGTEMQCYEAVAPVIAHVVSGSSVGPTGGSPGNAVVDHVNPMNGRWCAEVAHASVGMSRTEANAMVKKLLDRYEDKIATAPRGKCFQDLFDVGTLKPCGELQAMYARARADLIDMGMTFTY
jgi:methylamine---corrinoid protein Co-methyltransferase